MKYRSSIETSYLILATLADEKECAQYDMPQAVGKDYRTILRHLKKLEAYDLIQLARTEPAKKGGKDRKIYTLTLEGLVALLKIPGVFEPELMDTLATNYPDSLPLIFGKWQLFQKHGLKDLIINRLKKTLEEYPLLNPLLVVPKEELMSEPQLLRFLTIVYHNEKNARKHLTKLKKAERQLVASLERVLEHNITRKVLFDFLPREKEEYLRFLSVLKKDEELSAFITSEFDNLEKEYETYLMNLKSLRSWWESLEKAN